MITYSGPVILNRWELRSRSYWVNSPKPVPLQDSLGLSTEGSFGEAEKIRLDSISGELRIFDTYTSWNDRSFGN